MPCTLFPEEHTVRSLGRSRPPCSAVNTSRTAARRTWQVPKLASSISTGFGAESVPPSHSGSSAAYLYLFRMVAVLLSPLLSSLADEKTTLALAGSALYISWIPATARGDAQHRAEPSAPGRIIRAYLYRRDSTLCKTFPGRTCCRGGRIVDRRAGEDAERRGEARAGRDGASAHKRTQGGREHSVKPRSDEG